MLRFSVSRSCVLYACLKSGASPDFDYLKYGTDTFPIGQAYWNYLPSHLFTDGYIDGVKLVPILGRAEKGVRLLPNLCITPKGIEYLQENSMMSKAKEFLKSLKEIIPGF